MRARRVWAAAALLSALIAAAPAVAGPCENLVVDPAGLIGTTITGALTVSGPTLDNSVSRRPVIPT